MHLIINATKYSQDDLFQVKILTPNVLKWLEFFKDKIKEEEDNKSSSSSGSSSSSSSSSESSDSEEKPKIWEKWKIKSAL